MTNLTDKRYDLKARLDLANFMACLDGGEKEGE